MMKFQLQERGIAIPSYTRLTDKFAIRVAITNHWIRKEDLNTLINAVKRMAKEIELIL